MVSKGPLFIEGAVMRSMTGGVFFSPLIAVGDLPPSTKRGAFRGGGDGRTGSSAPTFQTEKTPLTMPSHGQGRKLRGTTLIWPVPRPSLRPITVPFRPAYCSFSREAPGPEHPSCPPPCTIRRLSLRQVSGRIPLLRHITKSFYADSADLSSLRRRFPKFRSG